MANYVCGLDLGQMNDWSALVVAEHTQAADGHREQATRNAWGEVVMDRVPAWRDAFDVVGIQRWRGTPYPAIVDQICRLLTEPPLRGRCSLTLDATGVGRPVLDLFDVATREGRLDFWSNEITITGGEHEHQVQRGATVPKFGLVQNVEVLLQTGRLRVVPTIPLADVLMEELKGFRAKLTLTGHVRWEAEGSGHDDLVIALALATWRPNWVGSPRHLLHDGTWYDPELTVAGGGGEAIWLPAR